METSYRRLTKRERAELTAFVSPGPVVLRAALFVVAVGAMGWLFAVGQDIVVQLVGQSGAPPVWALPTGVLAFLLYRRAGRWTGGAGLRARIRRDIERGEMAVHDVRVAEAIEAPEIEDEGPVFFIREHGGRILFLAGQEMARYKGRGFPWREFQISQAPESRLLFRLRSLGESFEPVEVRTPLTMAEARELGVLSAPFGFVDADWTELQR